jgi:lipoprotein signal peptidase
MELEVEFWRALEYYFFCNTIEEMKKIILLFFVLLTDTLSKYWVNISDPEFSVIGNILRITHVKNTGVAFGTPLPGISFVIPLILLGIGVFLWKSWNNISEVEKTGYIMIITGGLLNALERTFFGSVTDFISLQYFAVFNVADIAITGWVILLFWNFLLRKRSNFSSPLRRQGSINGFLSTQRNDGLKKSLAFRKGAYTCCN